MKYPKMLCAIFLIFCSYTLAIGKAEGPSFFTQECFVPSWVGSGKDGIETSSMYFVISYSFPLGKEHDPSFEQT